MPTVPQALIKDQQQSLQKALKHLHVTYQKIQNLSADVDSLDEETLETWESFAVRLTRAADLFLSRYLRSIILFDDPGFSGSFRDFLNRGEKIDLIDASEPWLKIRALRNVVVHEYNDADLESFYKTLRELAPTVLAIHNKLEQKA